MKNIDEVTDLMLNTSPHKPTPEQVDSIEVGFITEYPHCGGMIQFETNVLPGTIRYEVRVRTDNL